MILNSHGQKIRQWLEASDPNTNANHARELRHHGTGTWLLEHPAFQNWVSGTYRHLWLRGMPGCGKTVLSTTVLDHLSKYDNLVTLSFFFDFNDTMKQTKNGLLRSLVLQLYQGGHDLGGHLDDSFRVHKDGDKKATTAVLEGLVEDMLAAQRRVSVVLDALDESTTREEVLNWLKVMFTNQRLQHVQIIYTSREEAEFVSSIPGMIQDKCCLSLDRGEVDTDIRSYVMTRLQKDPGFTRKRLSDVLIEQIHKKVGNGANGM